MNRKKLWTRTSYAVLSAAIGLSPVISPLMSAPVYAQEETPETSAAFAPVTLHADDVTVEKKDGDNIVPLPQLGNARSFTYSADVLFNDYMKKASSLPLLSLAEFMPMSTERLTGTIQPESGATPLKPSALAKKDRTIPGLPKTASI